MHKFAAFLIFLYSFSAVQAQNVEGQIIASQFGQYLVPGQTIGSFQFPPDVCQVSGGNKNFSAFAAGVPVKIIDGNPAQTEIATPSSVYINTCSINMATAYTHFPPFYLTSGTGGLQEAITNGPSKKGTANTVILNADWYAQVFPGNPATVIATVQGNATIGLVDVTTIPYTFYQWNGTQYVQVTLGGGTTAVTGTLPIVSSGGATPNISCPTCNAQYGWANSLASTQGISDTTILLQSSVAAYPPSGSFYIDSEYETYTGKGTNQLTGISRGASQTTAANHTTFGTPVYSIDLPFGNGTQLPTGGVFGGPGGVAPQFLSVNCGTPTQVNDAGSLVALGVNCGSSYMWVDTAGRIHQSALGGINNYMSPIYIGNYPYDTAGGIGQPIGIINTTNVAQTNGAYQFSQPMGFGSGIAGPVASKSVPSIPAPSVSGTTGGSCNITYEVTGVDVDGGAVPGATATVVNLTFPGAGIVYIQTPLVAGVVTYTVWRTAVSGCGGTVTTGRFTTTQTAQYPLFQDTGNVGDGVSPPASNTSVSKVCTNGEQYCHMSGTTGTPPLSCGATANNGSPTYGWEYHNVSATSTPFVLHCVNGGSTWTTAY